MSPTDIVLGKRSFFTPYVSAFFAQFVNFVVPSVRLFPPFRPFAAPPDARES